MRTITAHYMELPGLARGCVLAYPNEEDLASVGAPRRKCIEASAPGLRSDWARMATASVDLPQIAVADKDKLRAVRGPRGISVIAAISYSPSQ
jgi:hypothetical protein